MVRELLCPILFEPSVQLTYQVFTPSGTEVLVIVVDIPAVTAKEIVVDEGNDAADNKPEYSINCLTNAVKFEVPTDLLTDAVNKDHTDDQQQADDSEQKEIHAQQNFCPAWQRTELLTAHLLADFPGEEPQCTAALTTVGGLFSGG